MSTTTTSKSDLVNLKKDLDEADVRYHKNVHTLGVNLAKQILQTETNTILRAYGNPGNPPDPITTSTGPRALGEAPPHPYIRPQKARPTTVQMATPPVRLETGPTARVRAQKPPRTRGFDLQPSIDFITAQTVFKPARMILAELGAPKELQGRGPQQALSRRIRAIVAEKNIPGEYVERRSYEGSDTYHYAETALKIAYEVATEFLRENNYTPKGPIQPSLNLGSTPFKTM